MQVVTGLNTVLNEESAQNSTTGDLNPEHHCDALLSKDPESPVSAADILVSSAARLLCLIRHWNRDRGTLAITHGDSIEYAKQMHRLTRETNSLLEWWQEEFSGQPVPPSQCQQTWLIWQYGRTVVNDKGAAALTAQPGLRAQCSKDSINSAFGFLEVCARWEPKEELVNLPCCFFEVRMADILTSGMPS